MAVQRHNQGFSLMELMIVVAIIGILSTIAYPSYRQYMIRGNRSAAQSVMMQLANREQQYLLTNRAYATLAQLGISSSADLPDDVGSHYDPAIVLGTGTVPQFTITFTPKGYQSSDGNLTLDSEGVKTPADKW